MKALHVQVERVVRPIRASAQRKDRMREELLAHLTCLFEEELAKTGDTQIATAEAFRRFGDAKSLTRELQASVSGVQRWAFFSFGEPIRRRTGESPAGFVLRSNAWGLAFAAAFNALLALVLVATVDYSPRRADQPTSGQLLILLMGTAVIQFATLLGEGLLCEKIRQKLEIHAAATTATEQHAPIWRIAGYLAMGAALLGVAAAGLMLLIRWTLPIPLITGARFGWITLAALVAGALFTLWQSWNWKAATRRFEQWESLDLDEPRAA